MLTFSFPSHKISWWFEYMHENVQLIYRRRCFNIYSTVCSNNSCGLISTCIMEILSFNHYWFFPCLVIEAWINHHSSNMESQIQKIIIFVFILHSNNGKEKNSIIYPAKITSRNLMISQKYFFSENISLVLITYNKEDF